MKNLLTCILALSLLMAACSSPKTEKIRKTEFEKTAGLVLDTIPDLWSANEIKLSKVASALCPLMDSCMAKPANYIKNGTWWRFAGYESAISSRHAGVSVKPGDLDVKFILSGYQMHESYKYDYRIDLVLYALMSADDVAELQKDKEYMFSDGSFSVSSENSVIKIKCAEYKAAEIFLCDVFAHDVKIAKF